MERFEQSKMAVAALRRLTPAHLAGALVAAAALVLAASQFIDYRGVVVAADTTGAGLPAPEVSSDPTGSAHSYLLLGVAVAALALLALSFRGRWRMSRLIIPLGLAVIAVSIWIDLPAAKEIAEFERAYVGVDYTYKVGIWMQLGAGVALVVTPLALAWALARRGNGQPSRRRRERLSGGAVEGVGA